MKRLNSFVEINNYSVEKCIALITDEHLCTKVETSNELGRVLGHIIASRNGLIGIMGGTAVDLGWGDFGEFSMTAQFDSKNEIPALSDLAEKWKACSVELSSTFSSVSTETLNKEPPFPIPVSEQSIGAFAAFMLFHESYHIGQLSLLVKEATGKTMFSDIA